MANERNPLREFLRSTMGDESGGSDDRPRPLPEAQVAELEALYRRYVEGTRVFAPGDLVTARRGHNIKGAGDPHIVVEINSLARPDFSGAGNPHLTAPEWGARWDMRVATLHGDQLCCFWAESWQYEPWVAGTEPAPPKLPLANGENA